MWAKMKKNGLWITIGGFGLIMGSNIYLVGEGWVSKEDNWFAMAIWATCFYVYWSVEMFATRNLKNTNTKILDHSLECVQQSEKLIILNLELVHDNKALLIENQRLEKQNVIQFRERKHD